jgi:transcriptional regulator with XRE-family HTH domain
VLSAQARRSAGLTQSELAKRLGTTQSAVAQLEDSGTNPTVARLDAALRATGKRLVLRADSYRPNIDETLLARNLRLSPAERLAAFEAAHREVEKLRSLKPNGG